MKQFFKELFEYSHHFNQKLGDILTAIADKPPEKSVKLYSHILNAHQVWNNRIDPKQLALGVWEIHSVRDCVDIDKTNYKHSLYILDNFDLNNTINYTNSKGQPFSNRIQDVLFHIINHSTYHRAQIATDFRQSGIEPLRTDYILYKRSNDVE